MIVQVDHHLLLNIELLGCRCIVYLKFKLDGPANCTSSDSIVTLCVDRNIDLRCSVSKVVLFRQSYMTEANSTCTLLTHPSPQKSSSETGLNVTVAYRLTTPIASMASRVTKSGATLVGGYTYCSVSEALWRL